MGVETAGGFVGQNNVGLVHQGTGYGYALLFATGEFGGLVVGAVGESEEVEQFVGAFFVFALRITGYHTGYHDVFEGGKLGQELMELKDKAEMVAAEVG